MKESIKIRHCNIPFHTNVIHTLFITDLLKTFRNSFLSSIFQDYFAIPIPARGEIVLEKALDYETTQSISLRVLAKVNLIAVLKHFCVQCQQFHSFRLFS